MECLKNILEDLYRRFKSQPNLPYKDFLKQELLHLGRFEKTYIRNKIISQSYDIGAIEVLCLLKETNIVSVGEYLGNIDDQNELLQIITDIFDDPSCSASLLEEILSDSKYSGQVDECMRNYVADVLSSPEIIKNEMITELSMHLSQMTFSSAVLPKFLNILLLHHSHERVSNLPEAMSSQREWNEKFKTHELLRKILRHLVPAYAGAITHELLTKLKSNDAELNWFFTLMTISVVMEEEEEHSTVCYKKLKKFSETQFRQFSTRVDANALYVSLIIARQLLHYSPSPPSSYKQWVKSNITELNYTLKDKSLFASCLELLQNAISYESDYDVLDVHISSQISAPSKEYWRVLEYKQLLVSRQESLS